MRYFLDTQLYSYLANGTIPRAQWHRTLGRYKRWLSAITAYELVAGLHNASPRTYPLSRLAIREATSIPSHRFLTFPGLTIAQVRLWLEAPELRKIPPDFHTFRTRLETERRGFVAKIRCMVERLRVELVIADPLFAAEWQELAGNRTRDNLDAAFVFHTAILDRTFRVLYKPEKHPSDYLDYLQLQYLDQEDLILLTADRRLVRMTSRSPDSERIFLWDDLLGGEVVK